MQRNARYILEAIVKMELQGVLPTRESIMKETGLQRGDFQISITKLIRDGKAQRDVNERSIIYYKSL